MKPVTISTAHYNEKLFKYGEFLHATIKDAAQQISCTYINTNDIIHIKCALFFNYEYPK